MSILLLVLKILLLRRLLLRIRLLRLLPLLLRTLLPLLLLLLLRHFTMQRQWLHGQCACHPRHSLPAGRCSQVRWQ